MPPELPETIGPFRVRELLGKAGQSAVYTAVAPEGRAVAIKLFPAALSATPAAVERFHREMRALIPVSRHPNLVQVLDTGQEGDRLYLVMERIEGTSLDRVLKFKSVTLVVTIATLFLTGYLYYIIPKGLFPTEDTGFINATTEAATAFETAAPSLTATLSTGEIRLGSLYYLPPETLEGSGTADARADLYSAGVIFHEMLTGRAPGPKFALPSQIDPSLPQEIDVVVLRCLARRPDERYTNAGDLLAALERLEETLRLRTLTEIREAGRLLGGGKAETGRRPVLLYLGIALVVLALAAAGFLLLR